MSETIVCDLLFRPDEKLAYLPEGPYPLDSDRFSWVSIQHSVDSKEGSLNIFNLSDRSNHSFVLNGRPGFAFPTANADEFIIGLERSIGLFNVSESSWKVLNDSVDSQVENTIINDGVCFSGGVIFGCKHLEFSQKIAGLYLFRSSDQQLIRLRDDQICSNGKIILRDEGGEVEFLDIDTPTKQVVRYTLDVTSGELSAAEVVLDLTNQNLFPDGMIATPDGTGVIISMFNPENCATGETRQYELASGNCVRTWQLPDSPQVTCPQLLEVDGAVKLIITTATENMDTEKVAAHPNAGCLFIGETPFDSVLESPRYMA